MANSEDVTAPVRPLIAEAIEGALTDRKLLTHPFYRRWEAGELSMDELAAYSRRYRQFEEALPGIIRSVADGLEADGHSDAAGLVTQNLADELGNPEPHLVLFNRFADAVAAGEPSDGADDGRRSAADALVATYGELVARGPVAGLAGLAAYETQAAAIAGSKADGLRRWYGIAAGGTEFWDVHATLDAEHGDWTVDALAAAGADPAEVQTAARQGADAWWAFLDEREAAAGVAAG